MVSNSQWCWTADPPASISQVPKLQACPTMHSIWDAYGMHMGCSWYLGLCACLVSTLSTELPLPSSASFYIPQIISARGCVCCSFRIRHSLHLHKSVPTLLVLHLPRHQHSERCVFSVHGHIWSISLLLHHHFLTHNSSLISLHSGVHQEHHPQNIPGRKSRCLSLLEWQSSPFPLWSFCSLCNPCHCTIPSFIKYHPFPWYPASLTIAIMSFPVLSFLEAVRGRFQCCLTKGSSWLILPTY